ncbi:MAG: TAXI family TRAP transporter solute-binding subunit [Candidatus Competibacteraceae bacterium]|jgi:TRAP transporter TAXI family solute receptor|nr:TAXI family TRAP transporter solute-binding subunit [Candidatus Competibacteraceae bacterium]
MGLLLIVVMLFGTAASQAQDRSYILATATTGGTYYPVGVAIATLIKVKLEPKHKISLSAISSAGSGENVKLLRENQAQFAILQGLYGAWAWNGEGQVKAEGPQKQLRSISMLWQNVEHFTIDSSLAKTGTIDDLKDLNGEKFSIGKRNSGTEGSGRQILAGLGIDPEASFELAYLGYGPSAEALQNGTIKGMNTPAGVPVAAVTQAFAALGDKITVLDFTDEQMQQANGNYDLWIRLVIPANTYPGQSKAIQTIAQPNFLAVREDIDEETVYLITKTLYENLPFLHNIHKATKDMDINRAIAGLPIPLHPGAMRYYQEVNLKIPDNLQVQ